ncbi:MAG: PAS domain S-box protein [Acidobacteriota bacterium]
MGENRTPGNKARSHSMTPGGGFLPHSAWWWRSEIAACFAILAVQACLLLFTGNGVGHPGPADIAELVLSVAVTLIMFFTAWRTGRLYRRLGWAWGFFGAAFLFAALGDACWTIFRITLSGSGSSILLNLFYLLFYPLFLLGVLRLPDVSLPRREKLNLLLEMGIVVVAAGLVFWNLLQRPTVPVGSAPWIKAAIASAYPAGDLALLWAFLTLVFGRGFRGRSTVHALLAASASMLIASDMLYSYAVINRDETMMIVVTLAYSACQLLAILAALRQLAVPSPAPAGPRRPGKFVPRNASLYLAYSCLAGALAVLLWRHAGRFPHLTAFLVAAMIILVLCHQLLAFRENRGLYKRLKEAKDHLEEKIVERTQELARTNRELQKEITERAKAEEALRWSEERFRSLVQNSNDIITLHDPDGRILYESPSASEIMGFEPGDLLGRDPFELVHPDDVGNLREAFQRTLEHRSKGEMHEYRFKHADGHWVYLESLGVNLLDSPAVKAIVLTTRDVTERRRAQDALEASEERFRRLSEATFEGVGLSENGVILDANRQLAEMFGYELEDFIGRHVTELVAPEHQAGVLESIRTESTTPYEHVAQRKDGTRFYVETQGSSLPYNGRTVRVSVIRDITERKQAEERIQHQIKRLEGLRAVDTAISNSFDLNFTLSVFLEQVTEQLEVDAASVLRLNPNSKKLEYEAGRGFASNEIYETRLEMGEGIAGRAAMERRLVEVKDLGAVADRFTRRRLLTSEGFRAYFAAPLVARGQVKGVFELFHRELLDPDEEWRNYLQALAGQAAVALDNMTLFRNLQQSNVELGLAYETTLEGWSRALEMRDRETLGHTMRVTEMTLHLARAVGVKDDELVHIRRGALLHDIGKMGIPDSILLKPGPLTEEEWGIMRQHADLALTLLWPIVYLRPALDIPYCHHERWNGSGYPRGLKGEQIPLAARVFAIVDNWDALSYDRPYRKAWPRQKVLTYLEENAGVLFDPALLAAFLEMVR